MRFLFNQIKKTYGLAEPEERKAVLHNFAFLSALQAMTYLLPILLLPYLFRVLGPDKFGLLAFAQAFSQYFIILTNYGFDISATKEISVRHQEPALINKTFHAVMTIKMLLLALSAVILAAAVLWIPRFNADWPVYVLSFGAVAGSALFPHWFFQGIEKMKPIADLNIFGGILSAVLIFVLVRGPEDYLLVPLVQSAVLITTGLWGQYLVLQILKVPFRFPPWADLKKELVAGWHVFISVLAINAYTTTRIFAVGLFTNNTLTGLYSAGEKIANLFQTFPLIPFSQALFPRLSKIFHKSKARAFDFMERIQRITVAISLICLPIGFIFAPEIVRVICGSYFPEAIWTLRIILISVLFIGSNAFRVQFLLIAGRQDLYAKIHILAAGFGLPFLLGMTITYSYLGAAISTVAIEFGIFLLTLIAIRKVHSK